MRFPAISFAVISVTALLLGCKKNDSVAATDSCQLTGTRAQAYADAITAYTKAQTAANCTAVKTTGNAYLDAAANCSTVNKADVDAARSGINGLTC